MMKTIRGMAFTLILPLLVSLAGCGKAGDSAEDTSREDAGLAGDEVTPEVGTPPPLVGPPELRIADPELEPYNLHLTWQHDPATTLSIQWSVTRADTSDYVPMVWYAQEAEIEDAGGTARFPLGPAHLAEGACNRFDETVFSVTPREDLPYVICVVELTGLVPDTHYRYRAGTFSRSGDTISDASITPDYTFRTGLEKGSREPFSFVAAGDSRGGYVGMTQATPRIKEEVDARFWLFNGDMNSSGTIAEWDQWFAAMTPIATDIVIMPVNGNHEKLVEVYYQQWALPRLEGIPDDLQEHYWSFDIGNVHMVGADSNTDFTIVGGIQWLETDLARAAADPDIDWIIVQFHHTAYSSSTSHGSDTDVQKHWVPLFEKYGVDLCISGHDHIYERTHPIRENQIAEDDGVVYLLAGAFYAPGYTNGNDWFTAVSHHGDKANYVIVDVNGTTLDVHAYSGDGTELLDEFSLSK